VRIRTITLFDNPGFPVDGGTLARAGRAAASIKAALEAEGDEVQTVRFALPPFASIVGNEAANVTHLARQLEAGCADHQIDYATVGPVLPDDQADLFRAIPDALGSTERIFASALVADKKNSIRLDAIRLAGEIIHRAATLTPDGFGNLRFAALADVPPNVPFFPAAYHDRSGPTVAVGLEAADLAVKAFSEAAALADARRRLIDLIETGTRRVFSTVGRSCPKEYHVGGIDCSLAPFPEAARSIGTAFETLTGRPAGERGTLAAVAFAADTLDRAQFPRAGYSGVFLPVFEDAVLAARASDGCLTVSDLLLWSSVCGTGLDTVPLPGDIPADAIAAILLDVAALALRLDKPLTARLMPIPGKRAGDAVTFDFPYFAPSRVLSTGAIGIGGLFARTDLIEIAPRLN
jgi:uncharacterized protein (UPF0210 family)